MTVPSNGLQDPIKSPESGRYAIATKIIPTEIRFGYDSCGFEGYLGSVDYVNLYSEYREKTAS